MVLQTPHLFSGTIRENIRYGKLDATDEEVEQAAQVAHAHDFIVEMDKGYDEDVGEGGGLLSVGQKQLVSIARAVLADPDILILDEATSSVDTMTEARIQQGMEAVMEGRTSFVIAHRLSTIKRADRILVIQAGRIVESGYAQRADSRAWSLLRSLHAPVPPRAGDGLRCDGVRSGDSKRRRRGLNVGHFANVPVPRQVGKVLYGERAVGNCGYARSSREIVFAATRILR